MKNLDSLVYQMAGQLLEISLLNLIYLLKKSGIFIKNGLKRMEQMKLDFKNDS